MLFRPKGSTHVVQAKFYLRCEYLDQKVGFKAAGGKKQQIYIGGKLYEQGDELVYDGELIDVRFKVAKAGQYPLII